MLVLSRKIGERIQIGSNITLTVLESRSGQIRLGFTGPADIPIHREEVYQRIEQELSDNSTADRRRPRVGTRRHALRAG